MTMLSRRTLLLASPLLFCASHLRADPSHRIVSIGGAVTEILYRLGLQDEIVGVDSTSLYPEEALKTKKNVGYVRQLGAEGVLSLNPTLVIASEGAGPPDSLRLIEQAGVSIVRVTDEPSAAGIAKRVETVAKAVDAPDRGAALVAEIEKGFKQLAEAKARVTRPAKALFVLSLQNGRPLVGGQGTTADAMLALAGATNVASSLDRLEAPVRRGTDRGGARRHRDDGSTAPAARRPIPSPIPLSPRRRPRRSGA